jgi:glycosyltransferase involved in cell wall biosynthesis
MLSRHGKSPSVIEEITPRLRQEQHNIVAFSDKRSPLFRMLHMIQGLLRNRRETSLVLLDTYSTSAFWYAWLLAQMCRILNIPYIPILHGGELENRLQRSPRASLLIFMHAFKIVSPSLFLQSVFRKYGYQDVIFIPNAIQLERYNFSNRKFFSPRLLWVRAFHKLYQPQMAIRVVKELTIMYPNCKLLMAGQDKDGSLEMCRRLAHELEVADNIEFAGFLPKSEWIDRAADFDIFLNTTSADNMPVSVIESMALGLPVVSTNVGGIPYLIENGVTGFTVDQRDVRGMVKAVEFICENPDAASYVAYEARKKVEAFDWATIRHQWNLLFHSALQA